MNVAAAIVRSWWLRAIVSSAVVVLLLTYVPLDRVWTIIRGVNPLVWAASVGIFVGGHALNALKLRLLVGTRRARATSCLRAHFAGLAANLGLPGVAGGDVVRATYLAPTAGAGRVAIAAVADRILDAFVLLLIAISAGTIAGLPPAIADTLHSGGWWLAGLSAGGAALVLVAWRGLGATRVGSRVRQAWSDVLDRPAVLGLCIAISLGVQTTFVLTNVWLASEMGVTALALAPWFLAWTGAKLSAILPISLGGLGVREVTLVSVLAAYGAPSDGVLATGILWEGALIVGSAGGFLVTQMVRR